VSDQPPPCNTGVPTPTHTVVLDYLAAHVEASIEDTVGKLCAELGTVHQLGRGMHGYSHCAELVSGDDVWVRVFYSQGGTPWLQASGTNAQPVENALRRAGLRYRCTRKDAALDLYDAEWFPILVATGKSYATSGALPLSVEHAGDWQYARKGRTLYVGSRRSRRFLRLYEKGRKEQTDPNWIRAEVQVNAQTPEEGYALAEQTPGQVWTIHAYPCWGRAIGIEPAEIFDYPVADPALRRVKRDTDRARRALAQQYGKTIHGWLTDCGGDPVAFVAELLAAVEHQARVRQWQSGPVAPAQELNP
jgi:DNA relaxase NicK